MSAAAPAKPNTPVPPTAPTPGTTSYEVSRPQGKCVVTGQAIEPGDKFMAALRELPAGFERVDVSLNVWPGFDRANVVAYWQTVMPKHEQKKKLFVDDEVLLGLFERLAETTEPNKLSFRFVLGLVLMRKRLLAYESSRADDAGRELWTMKMKGREDRLEMLNPRLDEQQVGEVSKQLGEILNEGL
ncbi:MAG: hypothetical protein ACREIT_04225 [Tepidisphaeraceae bacterium]